MLTFFLYLFENEAVRTKAAQFHILLLENLGFKLSKYEKKKFFNGETFMIVCIMRDFEIIEKHKIITKKLKFSPEISQYSRILKC